MTAKQSHYPAEFNYHMLKYALNDYTQNIVQLDSGQYVKILTKAVKSFQLESLVLASPEACGVIISEQQLQDSITEVRSRYQNKTEFLQDLEENSLNELSLCKALQRELIFDTVMQRIIATNTTLITDTDIALFYELHRQSFDIPEKRTARHILITINPDFPENTHKAALAKIRKIEKKLKGRCHRFEDLASRFSECPTAMEGGKLGDIKRGQLYSELDNFLFSMTENEISSIIQSEMGFHILLCEKIKLSQTISLVEATERIRKTLQTRNDFSCQKRWLAELQQKTPIMEKA